VLCCTSCTAPGNLERTRESLRLLGLKVLRERDIPEEKYANVFFGAGSESNAEHVSLEVTCDDGVDSYNVGHGLWPHRDLHGGRRQGR
jgi:lactoylglutathione lyase